MSTLSKFRQFPDGRLILAYPREASAVMKNKDRPSGPQSTPDEVSL